MSHTIVLGGGLCGLSAAMMLARDGHRVTVLERDPSPVPADADAAWERWRARRRDPVPPGALPAAARAPGARRASCPTCCEALQGGRRVPLRPDRAVMPPTIADRAPREGDERFVTWTGRRSTLEWVVARAADARAGRRDPPRRRRDRARDARGSTAACTSIARAHRRRRPARRRPRGRRDGPRLDAAELLAAAGGDRRSHEEAEDTRLPLLHALLPRRRRRSRPRARSTRRVGTFSILTLPGDNGTWSRHALRVGRRPAAEGAARPGASGPALVARLPAPRALARRRADHRRDADGRRRRPRTARFNGDGAAVATGVRRRRRRLGLHQPVDGARACRSGSPTPRSCAGSSARRATIPPRSSAAFAAATEAELQPWYDSTVLVDRARMAEIVALRDGRGRRRRRRRTSARASAARCRPAMSLDPRRLPRRRMEIVGLPVTARVTSSRAPASPSASSRRPPERPRPRSGPQPRGARSYASALTHRQLIERLLPLSVS